MKSSKWEFTDAINFVQCPKCGEMIGKRCRTPKGRFAQYPHTERCMILRSHPGYDANNYQR